MPSINTDTLNDQIRAILRSLFGADENFFRPANQDAPTQKMADPFATVLLTTLNPIGVDENNYSDVANPSLDSYELTVGPRHIIASIQFFRAGANTKAARLGSLLRSSNALSQFQAAGIGLVKVGSATNVAAVVDSLWEERAQLEVELYCISVEQAVVHTFGNFPTPIVNK